MDKEGQQKFYINVCRVLNPISLSPGCDSDAAVCMTEFDAAQVCIAYYFLEKVPRTVADKGFDTITACHVSLSCLAISCSQHCDILALIANLTCPIIVLVGEMMHLSLCQTPLSIKSCCCFIFEPTCAICMVGSYASLSVCLSARLSV